MASSLFRRLFTGADPAPASDIGALPGALMLVGYTLGHAVWSASDLEGTDAFVPLAVVAREGRTTLTRFEASSQLDAIGAGQIAMDKIGMNAEAWAFARDGLFQQGDKATDVISVDFWGQGMKAPSTICQFYVPFVKQRRFRLLGEPIFVVEGKIQESPTAKLAMAVVLEGVKCHPEAGPQWGTWRG